MSRVGKASCLLTCSQWMVLPAVRVAGAAGQLIATRCHNQNTTSDTAHFFLRTSRKTLKEVRKCTLLLVRKSSYIETYAQSARRAVLEF